jgi:hypothetical protein
MGQSFNSGLGFYQCLNPYPDLRVITFRGDNQDLSLLDCVYMRIAKVFICRDEHVFMSMAMINNPRIFYVIFWPVLIVLKIIPETDHLKPRIAKPLRPFGSAETVF